MALLLLTTLSGHINKRLWYHRSSSYYTYLHMCVCIEIDIRDSRTARHHQSQRERGRGCESILESIPCHGDIMTRQIFSTRYPNHWVWVSNWGHPCNLLPNDPPLLRHKFLKNPAQKCHQVIIHAARGALKILPRSLGKRKQEH